jgi:hypothetical protein
MGNKNEAKRKVWMDALQNADLEPSYDEDFDGIEVRQNGLTFVIPLESDDDVFVAVLLPNCWPLHSDEDRTLAFRLASEVSCEVKVAKAFINPDGQNVSMSGEIFLPAMETLPGVLARLLEAVAFARQRFGERMSAAKGQDSSTEQMLWGAGMKKPSKTPPRPNLLASKQGLRDLRKGIWTTRRWPSGSEALDGGPADGGLGEGVALDGDGAQDSEGLEGRDALLDEAPEGLAGKALENVAGQVPDRVLEAVGAGRGVEGGDGDGGLDDLLELGLLEREPGAAD